MKKQFFSFVANVWAHCFGVSVHDCVWVIERAKMYDDNYPLFNHTTCAAMAVTDWFEQFAYQYNKTKSRFLYNTAYNALMSS